MAWDLGISAIDQHLGSLFLPNSNERFDPLFALLGNHRAHLHAIFEAIAHSQLRGRFRDGVAEGLLRFADGDGYRHSQATLPGAPKGAVADDLRRHLHVGIRQNDHGILRAALALRAFPFFSGTRVDVAGYRSGTDKADGTHPRIVNQCVDRDLAAIHQVYDALGQPRFFDQFIDVPHRQRDALRRLQDEGIPRRNRIGQKPERNHARKVERHDRSRHTQRLADHHLVDAARDIFQVVALHHHRNAAGHLHILDRAPHLRLRLGEGLAILLRNEAADVIEVILE